MIEVFRLVWKIAWTLFWLFVAFKIVTFAWFWWRASDGERAIIKGFLDETRTPLQFYQKANKYISESGSSSGSVSLPE
tara:strand:+ start:510 stop:743 length:234 start_codon:yes stop_codon:yes gene_type:complete